MGLCSIYKITNNINGKVYVGQTWKSIKERFRKHKHISNKCLKIKRAIAKYGEYNFTIELITVCSTQKVADYLEEFFINQYNSINNGYNILVGGKTGGRKGMKTPKETIAKISKAATGRKHTASTKDKLSKIKKGVPLSEKHKLSLSIAKKGIVFSEAHKSNLLGNHKGMTWKIVDGKRVWMER
jgi:group I intron endonuclease